MHKAYALLQGNVFRQATMLAYIDNFWLLGVAILAMVPLVFLMKRPSNRRRDRGPLSWKGHVVFRVITVEREFGSGAAEIAREISDRLGWKLWDQALTEEIASEAQVDRSAVMYCDERLDSTFHRLAKTFWRGSYERSMPAEGH